MAGLFIKLIVCPVVVFLSGIIFREVSYATIHAPILIGLVLAAVAHGLEVMSLKHGTLWFSTLLDFAAATIIIYLLSLLLPGVYITLLGAAYTGLLLMFTEYAQHLWLLWKNKTRKA